MSFEIVPFEASLAGGCAEIERACFSSPWSEGEIAALSENPFAVYFAAVAGETVIAYGGLYRVLDEGSINNIGVLPEYRRIGAGRAILSALIDYSEKEKLLRLVLEVRASNSAAISLYKSEGFAETGLRKNFYSFPREDGITMEKMF